MQLFQKKHPPEQAAPAPVTARVTVIPDSFYGGQDPVIHYASEIMKSGGSQAPLKPAPSKAVPAKIPSAKKPHSHTALLILGSVLFLVFLAVTAWYYIRQEAPPSPRQVREAPPPPVRAPTPAPTATTTQGVSAPTSSPAIQPPQAVSARVGLGVFPRLLLLDGADLDADVFTDAEEEVFGTDSGVWDTDADGYYDGQEVVNLYNPTGFAPVKIIDSGLVREYIHPSFGYRVYFPASWESAAVDPEAEQVIFSAVNGDFIEARTFQKSATESFEEWFGRTVAGQSFSDLVRTTNRFDTPGWRRRDHLVAYYETREAVFVLIYHPAVEEAIQYRHIMMMMRESFRVGSP